MKKLIRVGMCALLVGFGVERGIISRVAHASSPTPKSSPASVTSPAAQTSPKPKSSPKPKKQKAPKTPSGKKATAKQALDGGRKAFAALTKAARADKSLDPKTPKNKPFWVSTKKMGQQLNRAQKGLAAKNDDFFKAIGDARSTEQQMKINWQLTGSKNTQVIENGKKLGRSLALLRTDFSKEAARKKKGGDLTPAEKQQFAKLKAQQTALLGKIKTLEAKAKKDKALAHGLGKIAKRANKIAKAPDTLDAYLAALYLLDQIEGMIYGYDYYVDKGWRADWIDVPAWSRDWDTIYTDFVATEPYEWVLVDNPADIDTGEEFEVAEMISDPEIEAIEDAAESEPIDISEGERDQVAEEQDADPAVESDDSDDDDSMEDASDEDGEDFDGDGEDDADDEEEADDADDDDGDDEGDDDDGDDDGDDDDGNDDDGSDDDHGGDDDDGGDDE